MRFCLTMTCLASLLLAGCGKPAPAARPPVAPVTGSGIHDGNAGAGRTDWEQPPLAGGEAYLGRSAAEWGQQLLDPGQSLAARHEASTPFHKSIGPTR